MVRRFLIKVLVSAVALWAADYILPGFSVSGGVLAYLIAGVLLGALNTFVRPILKLVAFPLILVTLGLFTFVINAAILWFVAEAIDQIAIAGIWSLVSATVLISIVQTIFEPKHHE